MMYRLSPQKHLLSTLLLVWIPQSYGMLSTGFNVSIPQFEFNGVIPANVQLPQACAEAYTAPIDCDMRLLISPNIPTKAQSLEAVCQRSCAASLLNYEKKVKEECSIEKGVDLNILRLRGSWLEFVISGRAGVGVYWKHCLRDLTNNEICIISQADYELAWNAATADTPDQGAVQAFCSNSCLTQTIVLNVGTQDNLNELARMCGRSVDIGGMPFIDHMVFAGLIRRPEEGMVGSSQMQETPLIPNGNSTSGSSSWTPIPHTQLLSITIMALAFIS